MPSWVNPAANTISNAVGSGMDPTWLDDKAKNNTFNSITFNSLAYHTILCGNAIASQTQTIYATWSYPHPVKIKAVSLVGTAFGASSGYSVNIFNGSGSVVYTPLSSTVSGSFAVTNSALFNGATATDPTLTATANTITILVPDNPNLLYGPNATLNDNTLSTYVNNPLTLRLTTPVSGTTTNLMLTVEYLIMDLYPDNRTASPTSDY
jgi:hypothetical protein